MSFHTLAYESSVASTSYTQLSAITDIYPQDSSNFVLKSNMTLGAAMAIGSILDHARLNQPSLNLVALPSIEPVVVSTTPGSNPGVCVYYPVGMPIQGNEDLEVDAANSSSSSTAVYALLWVYDTIIPLPQGPVYTLRGTASTTLTANKWTNTGSITWSSNLTQGSYQMVGLRGISATCVAVRAVILNQFNRPGCPGFTAEGQEHNQFFRDRKLGCFGSFQSYSTPTFDFLATSGDTSETVYMDVVKIG
jgi:hypothetical protein